MSCRPDIHCDTCGAYLGVGNGLCGPEPGEKCGHCKRIEGLINVNPHVALRILKAHPDWNQIKKEVKKNG